LIKAEIRAINKNMPVYKRVVDITIRETNLPKHLPRRLNDILRKLMYKKM